MIDPKELRIGNYVFVPQIYPFHLKVCVIFQDAIKVELTEGGIQQLDINIDCKPMALTKYWLVDFRFEKLTVKGLVIDGATYWRKNDITFYERQGKYYLLMGENLSDIPGSVAICFDKVHELQNIFSLTGEELTISEA